MARLVLPSNFLASRTLFGLVRAKDTADGAGSVIRPFMTENGIVLADDATAGTDADTQEALRSSKSKSSEAQIELRDKLWGVIDKNWLGEIQFLKKLYRAAPHQLGDWGITVDGNRINLPKDFINRVAVFDNFAAKHNSYAAGTSPLEPYLIENNITMATDEANRNLAKTANISATDDAAAAEAATKQRDLLWDPVRAHLQGIGQYLMGLYDSNKKKCGAWGYEVNDNKKAPVTRTTKLIPGSRKTINGIQLGSSVKNIGNCNIHIYQGTNTAGTPFIVTPNNEFGIMKGYSKITVLNPDSLKTAVFTVVIG